jgi:hypothetical protein
MFRHQLKGKDYKIEQIKRSNWLIETRTGSYKTLLKVRKKEDIDR